MKNKRNERNIVLCANGDYILYSLWAIKQIHLQTKEKINFILIHNSNISITDIQKQKLSIKYNIKFINFTSWAKLNRVKLPNSSMDRVTDYTNVRLFLPKILKRIEHVLYLDGDIYIEGDIYEMFKFIDKKDPDKHWGVEVYRAEEKDFTRHPEKLWVQTNTPRKENYFNAGVMYMNLSSMRKNHFISKSLKLIKEHGSKVLRLIDQDILNILLDIHILPWRMNITRQEQEKNYPHIDKLSIYHFVTSIKPWYTREEMEFKWNNAVGNIVIEHELHMQKIDKADKWKEGYNKFLKEIEGL